MNLYSQTKRIITVLLIFVLLIQLTGCYSYKPILVTDPSFYLTDQNHYVIYKDDNSKWPLANAIITNKTLYGRIDVKQPGIKNTFKVYSPTRYVFEFDSLNRVR